VKGVDAARGPRFTQPDYAMQAAVEGAGVVLGCRSLAQADLDSGRLTIPFDLPLPMDVAFYFVYPEASAERLKLARFREWLLGQTVASSEVRPRPGSASARGRRKGRASPLRGGRARSGV
jgi:LysR family transcriptional regulator, glycine cleavage system transcriptional activator